MIPFRTPREMIVYFSGYAEGAKFIAKIIINATKRKKRPQCICVVLEGERHDTLDCPVHGEGSEHWRATHRTLEEKLERDDFYNGETVFIRDRKHPYCGWEATVVATGSADPDELHIRLNRPPGFLVRARVGQVQKVTALGTAGFVAGDPDVGLSELARLGISFDSLEFKRGDIVIVDSQMSIYHQLEAVVTGFDINLSEQPWVHIQITTPGKSFNDTPRFRVEDLVKHEGTYLEGEEDWVPHQGTQISEARAEHLQSPSIWIESQLRGHRELSHSRYSFPLDVIPEPCPEAFVFEGKHFERTSLRFSLEDDIQATYAPSGKTWDREAGQWL